MSARTPRGRGLRRALLGLAVASTAVLGLTACGGATFTNPVKATGTEYWMVHHSAQYRGAGWDRQIDAQPFTWAANGAPSFGQPIGGDVAQRVPGGQGSRGD